LLNLPISQDASNGLIEVEYLEMNRWRNDEGTPIDNYQTAYFDLTLYKGDELAIEKDSEKLVLFTGNAPLMLSLIQGKQRVNFDLNPLRSALRQEREEESPLSSGEKKPSLQKERTLLGQTSDKRWMISVQILNLKNDTNTQISFDLFEGTSVSEPTP
jgi:hypothetical protein